MNDFFAIEKRDLLLLLLFLSSSSLPLGPTLSIYLSFFLSFFPTYSRILSLSLTQTLILLSSTSQFFTSVMQPVRRPPWRALSRSGKDVHIRALPSLSSNNA